MSSVAPVTAFIDQITGITENSVTNLEVFPNPNTGHFEIKLNNPVDATISLSNILGEILFEKKISNSISEQIDVSNFTHGIYYLKVQTEKLTNLRKVLVTNYWISYK